MMQGNPYGDPDPSSGGWGPPGGNAPGGWTYSGYGWPPGPVPTSPRRTLPATVTALLLAAAILVGLGIGHGVWTSGRTSIGNLGGGSGGGLFGPGPIGGNGGNGGSANSPALNAAATAVSPALVDINTDLSYQEGAAAGTGIVLTSNGIVLTNNHVIEGATTIDVIDVGNGRQYRGKVLGYDRTHDIAVVQMINASGLTAAAIGDSRKATVGQAVVGLGNALGAGGPPSAAPGQITQLDQSITADDEGNGTTEQLTGLIQTDANIQPGDSGGALVSAQGRVIGVDTAASSGFAFQAAGGQGFAIPIDTAMRIVNQIRSGQPSTTVRVGPTPFLGVLVDVGTANSSQPGAVLARVVPGGPAAAVGMVQGDVITSFGGKSVSSPSSLTQLILDYQAGDSVPVVWVDSGGQSHQATIQLSAGPAQ